MSTRRPRVKAAAILKPRRPQASNESGTDKTVQPSSDNENPVVSAINGNSKETDVGDSSSQVVSDQEHQDGVDSKSNSISENSITKSPSKAIKLEPSSSTVSEECVDIKPLPDTSSSKVVPKPPNATAMPTPFRRISTPPVNVVTRLIASENRPSFGSPKYNKSPSYSFVRDAQPKDVNKSPHHNANSKSTNGDEEIFSPAPVDNDECFKSPPFMSPIYTRRIEPSPSMSPFHDIYGEDYTKSPSQLPNNTKIRQRIRPTPCFASRRNSIQGSGLGGAFETEDEQHRRQRHYSTSSNHSSYNPASTPQHQRNYFGLNKIPSRVRTESYSSSISDIPFSKNKRSHRSEEYQRVANAKREFNQRLNGQPPDKSRLTMYDLIYYNPLTNPMSKPAGKGDKNSDTASVSSAKTNQSRGSDSVKSEASVKTEKSENTDAVTGPVPQLKLDANGEIILDEKSLVIETTGDKEAREMLANSDVVYDDEFSGTSGFYKRQKRTRDWLPLETLKFYRSLQTIGTDFSVMLQLFPNRSRRDLKLKFKKEEKHNMALINKALLHPKEFNVDELKLQFDKEDEEIEQKKQEWAEVRKKMATERREQLNASKRRNPNKQLSRTVRSLTVGDMVYDNEFVTLPPKTKRNRKRDLVIDPLEEPIKNPPDDSVFSPPLNHNNNHVDPLPQHTYATHKLPSFIEMISSQKSRSNSSSSPTMNTSNEYSPPNNKLDTNDALNTHTESNRTFCNDEESVHAIDLSTTSGSLVVHGAKNTDPVVRPNNGNQSTINQYIAKNPNLTFKGTGDIMNMDIIFENVSIEEDTTIGNDSKTTTSSGDDDGGVNEVETMNESAAEEHVSIDNVSDSQVEHVDIDGVHYQIITIENANEKSEELDDENQVSIEQTSVQSDLSATVNEVSEIDNSIPVIGLDSNEVVIISNLDVAAEVETGDLALVQSTNEIPLTNTPKVESISNNTGYSIDSCVSIVKDETIPKPVQSSENTANDRKRKRKVVPLLENNKRTRRSNANHSNDNKTNEQTKQHKPIEQPYAPSDNQTEEKPVEHHEQIETTVKAESSTNIQGADNNETPLDTTDSGIQLKAEPAQSDTDASERNFMDSLVVVESQDPNDSNRTIHEVYVVDPDTNEMSEKPLDLPDHVIQRIRLAIS